MPIRLLQFFADQLCVLGKLNPVEAKESAT
jgi:hypothetical protein